MSNRTALVEQVRAEPGSEPAETVLEIENLQTHFFTASGVVRTTSSSVIGIAAVNPLLVAGAGVTRTLAARRERDGAGPRHQ